MEILLTPVGKQNACKAIMQADENKVMVIREKKKSRSQEQKYHAMIGDIADQLEFMGNKMDTEDWKRLLVDAFAKVMQSQGTPIRGTGRIVPSLDGMGVVQLGMQTRNFTKAEGAEFIEYLHAFGEGRNVKWSTNETMPDWMR